MSQLWNGIKQSEKQRIDIPTMQQHKIRNAYFVLKVQPVRRCYAYFTTSLTKITGVILV